MVRGRDEATERAVLQRTGDDFIQLVNQRGAIRKVLTRKVLIGKVLNLQIGLRVVLTARGMCRALRKKPWTAWLG